MRRVFAVITVLLTLVVMFLPPQDASATGPTGPPPFNGHVLAPGVVPTHCSESDGQQGASAYAASLGYYWSDDANS